MKISKNQRIAVPEKIPVLFQRKIIEDYFNCSERTAQRIIDQWLKKDLIEIQFRSSTKVVYQRKQVLFHEYQKSFLDQFIPQKRQILTPAERKHLTQLSKFESEIDLETYQIRIYERLLIELSWASSSLEGNTYSLLETEQLLSTEVSFVEGKSFIETQMILNHKEAIKFLILNKKVIKLDERTIKSVHALLGENLMANPNALGALRKIPVGISGTSYSPLSTPQQLEDEFQVFLKKINLIEDPIEQSLMALIFIPYIQPFEDVNKRTSRICCNIPLVSNNLLPISFKNTQREPYLAALKDVYELNSIAKIKEIFISALETSAKDYKHIVAKVVEPSLVQIKYRAVIKGVVHHCVREKRAPQLQDLQSVPPPLQNEVLMEIQRELDALHEGSLVRFNLTPSDFRKWKHSGAQKISK